MGDALSESYWIALPIILASYLGVPELEDNVDDTPADDPYHGPRWEWETEARREFDRLPPLVKGPDGIDSPQPSNPEAPQPNDPPDTPTNPT